TRSTREKIKRTSHEVGHSIARRSRAAGHTIARDSKTAGHQIAHDSRKAGRAISSGAHQLGSKVRTEAHKVKTTIEEPPATTPAPRRGNRERGNGRGGRRPHRRRRPGGIDRCRVARAGRSSGRGA